MQSTMHDNSTELHLAKLLNSEIPVDSKGGTMATAKPAVVTMKVAQVPKPGGDFEIVERAVPNPDAGQVRIKVQACGICHSDAFTKDGSWPGIQYPRVPGHEVVGVVDEVGDSETDWKKRPGEGGGWHGAHE